MEGGDFSQNRRLELADLKNTELPLPPENPRPTGKLYA